MASTVLFSEDHDDKASSSGSSYEHWPDDFSSSRASSPVAVPGYDSHNGLRTHVYQFKKDPSPEPAASTKSSSTAKEPEKPKPKPTEPRVIYVQAQPPQIQQQAYTYYPSQYVYGGPLQPHPVMMHKGQPVHYVYAAAPAPDPAPAPAEKEEDEKEKPKKSSSPKMEFTYVPKKCAPPEEKKKSSTNPWIGRTKAQVDEDNVKIAKQLGAYEKRKVAPTDAKNDQPFWVVETDGSHTLR